MICNHYIIGMHVSDKAQQCEAGCLVRYIYNHKNEGKSFESTTVSLYTPYHSLLSYLTFVTCLSTGRHFSAEAEWESPESKCALHVLRK